ncbi:MAG: tRNA (adenosine(37)-N6)-threonylcarbamoyltransferase complex ATPase subunit type 1 TsaE [Paracoccaceae bacterium]
MPPAWRRGWGPATRCLAGEIGAGKTHFARALDPGAAASAWKTPSPTFTSGPDL